MVKKESLHLMAALTVAVLAIFIYTTSAQDFKPTPEESAMKYLKSFGYFDKSESDTQVGMSDVSQLEPEVLKQKLMDMQYMAGLNQTGVLDEATLKMMQTPRCSVPDTLGLGGFAKRRRRYVIGGPKWRNNAITYRFSKYTEKLSQDFQKQIIAKALGFWSAVTPLTFSESSTPDIDILFASEEHGDGDPFDGPLNVLAHAYFPGRGIGGDAHFDNDETWTDGTYSGVNLLQVAIHEFGHSLGLSHSNEKDAIMYAHYTGYQPNAKLASDDIAGIQYIYGPNTKGGAPDAGTTSKTTAKSTTRSPGKGSTGASPPSPYPTDKPVVPAICSNPSIDDIVYIDGVTYAFKDDSYYVLNNNGIEPGYPKKTSSNWPGLNGKVDAIINYPAETSTDRFGRTVVVKEGSVFFFQGSQCTKYTNVNKLVSGYPKPISSEFPGLPHNLDTCFTWSGNGRIFCTKGNQYYRYSPGKEVDAGYPKPLSAWGGLPSSISAAFQWKNGVTYFFSQTTYYKFDDLNFNVASANPPYPRNTGQYWFGCSVSGNLQAESSDDRNQLEEIDTRYNSSAKFAPLSALYILAISYCVFLFRKYL